MTKFTCQATASSCEVSFDGLVLVFRTQGDGLILHSKARHDGGRVPYIQEHVYNAARAAAKKAIAEHQRNKLPQMQLEL